ncbi:MAG: DUF1015 domain-containing protein [Thermoanaerobaculia bacterium]
MAKLTPIRATRPEAARALDTSSVPYDVVSTEEARALAAGNPLSFLHVTRSEIDLPADTDPYSDQVYELARENFARLRREAPLVADVEPSLYLYRLRMGEHVQTGVAGAWSLDEYDHDRIKKHEKTRRDKEDDRTRHITTLRAQTGIVFLTYRASNTVDGIVARASRETPLYDFVSADGVAHTMWRVDDEARDRLVAAFAAVPDLYIADGHHRAASAARASQALTDPSTVANAGDRRTFLAVAFPDHQMNVLPYHRAVRDLNGRDPGTFLAELGSRFESVQGPPQPVEAGRFSVYVAGRWSTFLLPPVAEASPIARLDCARLQESVLAPLLGIGDPRTDKRIDFIGGIRGTTELERRVDSGEAAVAFALFPVSVEDLFAVSDAGEIMPPKSTWFEPKLRDGLLVHEI